MTATEWLFKQLWDEPKDKFTWYAILDKAIQMEKQQIKDAYDQGDIQLVNAEQYYNETYEIKGIHAKDYTEVQKNEERINNAKIIRDVTSSQTEISDEEIKKTKESNWDFMDGTEFELLAWIEGAKWQKERMYSEEDLISFAHFYFKEEFNSTMQTSKSTDEILQEWFEQFKKK